MNRKAVSMVCGILLVAAVWLGVNGGSPRAEYQARVDVDVERWEYQMVAITNGIAEFNRLGADGWELCATMGDNSPQAVLFFKRPLR